MQGVKTLVECEWGIKFLDRMFVKDLLLYQGTHANMGHGGSLRYPSGK